MTPENQRQASVPIAQQFLERWSPRSFRSDELTPDQVQGLFEAARWAPSCFNEQPWLFVYGQALEDRERIAGLLVEGNRIWAQKAPLLGLVFARRAFARNGKANRWSSFDAGAAAFSLALQAHSQGLAAHFMGGFDEAAAYQVLGVPEAEFAALAAFAVGQRGASADLPAELAEREGPSQRKPLAEIAHVGRFVPV